MANVYEVLTYIEGDVAVTGWDIDREDDAFLATSARLRGRLNRSLRESTARQPRLRGT